MDPLLKSLSDSTLRQLVQEQRPAWAVPLGQGRADVAAPAEQAGPPLPQELGTYRRAASQAYEAGKDPLNAKDPFYKRAMRAILALGDPRALEDIPSAISVGEGFFNPAFGAAGILAGPKAAKQLGGLAEAKFHAGRAALERGDAPQAVWRTWGVARTKEGNYVFEPPLMETESEAIDQFRKLYPKETLRVLRGSGSREGSYNPLDKEIYARGDPKLPGGNFQSRRTVLEHELQHAVDDVEGVSYGTNLADPKYHNNAAEVRARAVERRLDKNERVWEPSMHEDVDRMDQVIKRHPLAVAEAVKEPGGMWHPEAVERLSEPLYSKLATGDLAQFSRAELRMGEGSREPGYQQNKAAADWSDRAIRNYLNKYAGTERDPLKDVEIPFKQGTKRWEEIWDSTIQGRQDPYWQGYYKTPKGYRAPLQGLRPDEPVYGLGKNADPVPNDAITSYLSHVGDYLRQNVKPEKLSQYDLVRAVKETAAWDKKLAAKMAEAKTTLFKDAPVYKEYPSGFKWIQLNKPGQFANESDVMGHSVRGYEPTKGHEDWSELSKDYGYEGYGLGGWDSIKSGDAKVYSLRDAQGNAHVTVEVASGKSMHPSFQALNNQVDAEARRRFGNNYTPEQARHIMMEWEGGGQVPDNLMQDNILQIKGKQNRAPNAEYLPYVQDFVRGGKWGEVGDLQNTGLRKVSVGPRAGQYLTDAEITASRQAGEYRPLQDID